MKNRWQSKYFDPNYGKGDEAREEASTLLAKHVRYIDPILPILKIFSFPLIATQCFLYYFLIVFLISSVVSKDVSAQKSAVGA